MTNSEIIKTVRDKLGMSQDELAHTIFVSTTTVSRWENGRSIPSRMAREMLADYCSKQNIEYELIQAIRKIR